MWSFGGDFDTWFGKQKTKSDHEAHNATRRIMKDIRELAMCANELPNITAEPLEQNCHLWHANIRAPAGSPEHLEGLVLHVEIRIPPSYPRNPPKIKMLTPFSHPNVFGDFICLSLLRKRKYTENVAHEGWSGAYSMITILSQLQSFLFAENVPQDYGSAEENYYQSDWVKKRYQEFECDICGHSMKGDSIANIFPKFKDLCVAVPMDDDSGDDSGLKYFPEACAFTLFEFLTPLEIKFVTRLYPNWYAASDYFSLQEKREATCFFTRLTYKEAALGFGVRVKYDPYKPKIIRELASEMDLLSYHAWNQLKQTTSVWGYENDLFVPLVLTNNHYRAARKLIFKQIIKLANIDNLLEIEKEAQREREVEKAQQQMYALNSQAQEANRGVMHALGTMLDTATGDKKDDDTDGSAQNTRYPTYEEIQETRRNSKKKRKREKRDERRAGRRFINHTGVDVIDEMDDEQYVQCLVDNLTEPDYVQILDVLSGLMNSSVVGLLQTKGEVRMHHSEKAMQGYTRFHQLFLKMCEELPRLRELAEHNVQQFVEQRKCRHKKFTPDIGKLLVQVSLSDHYRWEDIKQAIFDETMVRNVRWYCAENPFLRWDVDSRTFGTWFRVNAKTKVYDEKSTESKQIKQLRENFVCHGTERDGWIRVDTPFLGWIDNSEENVVPIPFVYPSLCTTRRCATGRLHASLESPFVEDVPKDTYIVVLDIQGNRAKICKAAPIQNKTFFRTGPRLVKTIHGYVAIDEDMFKEETKTTQAQDVLWVSLETKNGILCEQIQIPGEYRLNKVWNAIKISRRLLCFQKIFLNMITRGRTINEIISGYNHKFGNPPRGSLEKLQKQVETIKHHEVWSDYFDYLDLPNMSRADMVEYLKRCVTTSERKRYHRRFNPHYDEIPDRKKHRNLRPTPVHPFRFPEEVVDLETYESRFNRRRRKPVGRPQQNRRRHNNYHNNNNMNNHNQHNSNNTHPPNNTYNNHYQNNHQHHNNNNHSRHSNSNPSTINNTTNNNHSPHETSSTARYPPSPQNETSENEDAQTNDENEHSSPNAGRRSYRQYNQHSNNPRPYRKRNNFRQHQQHQPGKYNPQYNNNRNFTNNFNQFPETPVNNFMLGQMPLMSNHNMGAAWQQPAQYGLMNPSNINYANYGIPTHLQSTAPVTQHPSPATTMANPTTTDDSLPHPHHNNPEEQPPSEQHDVTQVSDPEPGVGEPPVSDTTPEDPPSESERPPLMSNALFNGEVQNNNFKYQMMNNTNNAAMMNSMNNTNHYAMQPNMYPYPLNQHMMNNPLPSNQGMELPRTRGELMALFEENSYNLGLERGIVRLHISGLLPYERNYVQHRLTLFLPQASNIRVPCFEDGIAKGFAFFEVNYADAELLLKNGFIFDGHPLGLKPNLARKARHNRYGRQHRDGNHSNNASAGTFKSVANERSYNGDRKNNSNHNSQQQTLV